MAPFRWPTVANNLQLDTEVAARRPNSPSDWEVIAVVLSQAFSTDDDNQVELTGRACRERMDRLFTKYNEEDKKSLKKSGTEEEYSNLMKLLEDISTYQRDVQDQKKKRKKKTKKRRKKRTSKKPWKCVQLPLME
ncbi:uncharacterized protein LOC144649134 [Oculina patagonica]